MSNLVLIVLIYLLYYNFGPAYAQDGSEDEQDEISVLDKLEELDQADALDDTQELEELDLIDKTEEEKDEDDDLDKYAKNDDDEEKAIVEEFKLDDIRKLREHKMEEEEEEPEEPGCFIDPVNLDTPMILKPKTSDIVYPEPFHIYMTVEYETEFELVCPGTTIKLGDNDTYLESITATCIDSNTTETLSNDYKWDDISCADRIVMKSVLTGNSCATTGKEIDVVITTEDGRKFTVFTICFDVDRYLPLYTSHDILGTSERIFTPVRPLPIDKHSLYTLDPAAITYYHFTNQKQIMNTMLNESRESEKYINDIENAGYLYRLIYLTTDYDFFYAYFRNATYRSINSAAMWHIIQMSNWDIILTEVRNYAYVLKIDIVKIWTGTYGISTKWDFLPEETRNKTENEEISLSLNPKILYIPALFWKLIYRPDTKEALVIVLINNPHRYYNLTQHVICEDISTRVEWMYSERTQRNKGYNYACSYTSFKRVVTYAPDLDVQGEIQWNHSHIIV